VFSLMTVMAVVIAGAGTDYAAEWDKYLTPENLARIEKGEIISFKKGEKEADGTSSAKGRVLAIVNRSRDDVWNLLTNKKEDIHYAPHLANIECYFEEGNRAGYQETVKVAFKTWRYHVIHTRDKDAGVITWELDKSKENSVRDTAGSWMLRARDDGRCIVMYTVSVDSGAFFPKMIENYLFNTDLPNIVKAMKSYIESKKDSE